MTPVAGECGWKPHPGGGGCWGPAVGTSRSRDGNVAWLRCWRHTGLVHRLLPASLPPTSLASSTSGMPLPVVFSLRPHFWTFGIPEPLVPQILSLSQARGCGSKSRTHTEGEPSSDLSWEDFGGDMSSNAPRDTVGVVPEPPCPDTARGGAGATPSPAAEPWQ